MHELVTAAGEYLNAGLSVIALAGKHPNGAIHHRGLNEPLAGAIRGEEDKALVHRVFTHSDTTGVGIVLPDYLVVIDIDGEEGARVFREMVPTDEWRDAAVASTGRGLHLYYLSGRPRRTTKLGEKLDLKGVGGYVAAPPSLHPSGTRYEWLAGLVVDGRVVTQYLPDSIEGFLDAREKMQEATVRRPVMTRMVLDPESNAMVPVEVVGTTDGLVNTILNAKDGERNNILNWAAYRAKENGVPYEDALRELGTAAADAGLEAHEIRQTIRSAYRSKR